MQLIAVKPMGALGRIVIPAGVRETLGMKPGAEVGVYADGDRIVLRVMGKRGHCTLCGGTPAVEFGGKWLCEGCIDTVHEMWKLRRG
jgi:AbrB family looped-hinge helix DNA binding protein